MIRRITGMVMALCLLLNGCAGWMRSGQQQYTATYLDLFDTVTTIVGTASSRAVFDEYARKIYGELARYHRLFDIYHAYDGIHNLKTVNDCAGKAPVVVDRPVIELLQDCKTYYELTDGLVNVAMGAVLCLWHTEREMALKNPSAAKIPDAKALAQAAQHTDINHLVLDLEASSVYLADPELRLDVGAIAKGWAAERVARQAPEGMLISIGGNVCVTGPKDSQGTPWVIGIQNPDGGEQYLHTLRVSDGAVVTSGDYQRVYFAEGKSYHHIIDPATQMPSEYWRSVTVVCGNSALADALSTALFLLPLEQGRSLARQAGAEVLWVDSTKAEYMTDGFRELLV